MTGDSTTQFYRFPGAAEAEAFVEAMKRKGVHVRSWTVSENPEEGGVLLAVEATSAG